MELPAADAPSRDRPALPDRPPADARPLPRPPNPPGQADTRRLAERLDRMENPVGVRAELRDRLNGLVAGHPSSPWDERGIPRPPVTRLADVEGPMAEDAALGSHNPIEPEQWLSKNEHNWTKQN